jgi:SAM-dependent methyltransferase
MKEMAVIEYDIMTLTDGRRRKLLPDKKFNRKTFDPFHSDTDRAILNSLRTTGRGRYLWLRHNDEMYPSTSMRYLLDESLRKGDNTGESYIDFGCGESGDRFIAHRMGYHSLGMDLFPPIFTPQETKTPGFITGDIAEPLPFRDYEFTYATCHAVIALLLPEERERFYKEVYRCLKIGGTFVLTGVDLKNGYGFDLATERSRLLRNASFDYVRSLGYGVAVEKN